MIYGYWEHPCAHRLKASTTSQINLANQTFRVPHEASSIAQAGHAGSVPPASPLDILGRSWAALLVASARPCRGHSAEPACPEIVVVARHDGQLKYTTPVCAPLDTCPPPSTLWDTIWDQNERVKGAQASSHGTTCHRGPLCLPSNTQPTPHRTNPRGARPADDALAARQPHHHTSSLKMPLLVNIARRESRRAVVVENGAPKQGQLVGHFLLALIPDPPSIQTTPRFCSLLTE